MERQEIEIFLTLAGELHFGRTADRRSASWRRRSRGRRRPGGASPAGCGSASRGRSPVICCTTSPTGSPASTRGVDVQIRQVQISDPYGPLRAGDIDLQVTEPPVIEADLTTGPVLLSQPRVLLMSSSHPFARRESVSVEDLAEATLLTVASPVPRHWLDHHFPRQTPSGRPIPHGQAITHWEDALSLVLAGKGVTPNTRFIWPTDHETGRLRAFVTAAIEHARRLGGPDKALDTLWETESGS